MNRKAIIRLINCILIASLTIIMVGVNSGKEIYVQATSIDDVRDNINQFQEELIQWTAELADLEDELDLLEEKMEDLNAEIINMMTSIGLKEEEIEEKEDEIYATEIDIANTQEEYDAARIREAEQYEAMVTRMRYMYESGNHSVLYYLMGSTDLGDFLNKADYAEKVLEHDKQTLDVYKESKNLVHSLWMKLETDKEGLQIQKEQLEKDREEMRLQKEELDRNLVKLQQESSNYESEIARARQEAAAAQTKLRQEQQKLSRLEEEQRRAAAANAAGGNYSVSAQQFDTSIIDNAAGSDLGKKIAKYACQFIGNPYVAGGTSLTNGADCSGFTYRVYSDFGYRLPRSSYEQRSVGTGVAYEQAQPGDIICYEGHVGIYVGGGFIVHASTARSGIKISRATYRSIITVRRVI